MSPRERPSNNVVIGEESAISLKLVITLVAAFITVAGIAIGVIRELDKVEGRLAMVEFKVDQIAARTQHASNP